MLLDEIRLTLLGGLETALNQALQLDPDTQQALAQENGKVIALQISGLHQTFYLLPGPGNITVMQHYADEPDVIISGPPASLFSLALSKDSQTILHRGDVTIRGDMELGQRFNRLLKNMQLDWEEGLAQITGDVIAYKLANLLRSASRWGRDSGQTLAENAAEYLHYEGMDVPLTDEVEAFNQGVDRLRDDSARLEARLKRLETQQQNKTKQT